MGNAQLQRLQHLAGAQQAAAAPMFGELFGSLVNLAPVRNTVTMTAANLGLLDQ